MRPVIDFRIQLPPEQRQVLGEAGLAALMAVAHCADAGPSPKALAAIRGVRDHLLRIELDLETLPSLDPIRVAERVRDVNPDPQWRERILRGMTLVALLDGEPNQAQLALLEASARAFGVDAAPVRTFRQLMAHQLALVRLDIGRRGFVAPALGATLRDEGLAGALGVARVLLGQGDPALAARYRALLDYPAGSFGQAYASFITHNGFSFPGEVGGPPPPVMHHDCCHVLGGYGTTAAEEGAVLGFQAGFERADPFYVLMFALAEFELGLGVSPFIPGQRDQLDVDRIFAGIEHGAQVNVDLLAGIDPWEHFVEPLALVRERFNVLPRGREPEYPPPPAATSSPV
ncbi:TerB family tellurite resistance protein [Vulcanococcus limneticus Candia 3B3]|nr:TerB family tellurite resistance protein [Vulcanococcus limneticus MW73D5]MCP9897582.1 TerB family tellurite resistance protein [Vulcanococcus limneticus Candia 3B3]